MDKIKELIRHKPNVFVYVSLAYVVCVVVYKWLFHPSFDAIWFFLGSVIGVYFLDAAEIFFALSPSPFRSIVFCALFTLVSLFVVTSSASPLAIGLVLSLYLQIIQRQIGEWHVAGHVSSWYRMVAGPVPLATQRMLFFVFVFFWCLETVFFVR